MTLSAKQQDFINTVEEGKSVFLTGKAGTGKSFVVLNYYKRKVRDLWLWLQQE